MFYDSKHVLVTGGTGFVGTHIVQELLKYKAQVRIPIHKRQPLVTGEHIETIEADLISPIKYTYFGQPSNTKDAEKIFIKNLFWEQL